MSIVHKLLSVSSLNRASLQHRGIEEKAEKKIAFFGKTVLRLRIRDPVLLLPLDPGWEKIRIKDDHPGSYFRDLGTIFWVKNTVKAGNFVTFFAQINFFLKNALR